MQVKKRAVYLVTKKDKTLALLDYEEAKAEEYLMLSPEERTTKDENTRAFWKEHTKDFPPSYNANIKITFNKHFLGGCALCTRTSTQNIQKLLLSNIKKTIRENINFIDEISLDTTTQSITNTYTVDCSYKKKNTMFSPSILSTLIGNAISETIKGLNKQMIQAAIKERNTQ